jgi:DNA processing protein
MSCHACSRRSRLLTRLGVSLDFRARDPARLWQTLELPDELMIAALAGRKREALLNWHASPLLDDERRAAERAESVCRHDAAYPRRLTDEALAPHELHVTCDTHSLNQILTSPTVAIVGSRRCTDYGLGVAHCLARELAAAGVSLLSELSPGIGQSAQAGAFEDKGAIIAAMSGGLDKCPQACWSHYRQIPRQGCLIAELPRGAPSRRWSELARTRTLALLADLVIVVEAQSGTRELACAQLADALGRKLAAVPGRVTSPASEGTNQLLFEGVDVVRSAEDALDLLYEVKPRPLRDSAIRPRYAERAPTFGPRPSRARTPMAGARALGSASLERRLRDVLRQIGEGKDTIAKLEDDRTGRGAPLLELAELELRGLVICGDGGRYVPLTVTACG